MSEIKVQMFGTFSLSADGMQIDDSANRSHKVWLLLAYLIYSRNSSVTQSHYIDLLQSAGGDDSADPNGKLKAMFYRARTMLNQLDADAGHNWIIRKNGTYAWNTEVEVSLDVEEFERACAAAAAASSCAAFVAATSTRTRCRLSSRYHSISMTVPRLISLPSPPASL